MLPETSKVENYLWLLDAEKQNKINKKDLPNAILQSQRGMDKEEILNSLKKSELDNESKKIIDDVLNKNKDFIKNHHSPVTAIMGTIMKELAQKQKKPDMKQLAQYLEQEIKKMKWIYENI